MIIQVLHCPYCQGTDIVRHGKSPEGKQRYRCRQCREGQGCTFLLDYSYAGQSPDVKEQIIGMAMNASGIRDTFHLRFPLCSDFPHGWLLFRVTSLLKALII